MAISFEYPMQGLLGEWQRMNSEGIWRFGQAAGTGAPLGACPVYIQEDRQAIADALLEARTLVETWLGYFHRPTWHSEEIRMGRGSPWELQTLQLTKGYFIEWGSRATSLISAGAAIVYSDPDGDGINELATITVATTVDADEIEVYFQVADGADSAGDERFQIEPVKVSVSGGVATITGHRALFVKPSTIWRVPFSPSDPNYRTRNYADTALATGFVTNVDIYRVYNDSTIAAQILSDPIYDADYTNLGTTVVNASEARIVNSKLGIFEVRFECGGCHPPYPEYARVYYRSGLPLVYGNPDLTILRAIIRLANAGMYRKLCSFCPDTQEIWTQDREQAIVAQRHVNNPFGTTKGAVAAWLNVYSRALAQGGSL